MLLFTTLILAAVAAAAPQATETKMIPREALAAMTVGQANDVCGKEQSIHCCNDSAAKQSENHSNGVLAGVLTGLLGNDGLRITGQCSPIDLTVIGANSLLHNHCSGKIACCEKATNVITGGLVNVGLPCIAIGSLID